MDLVITIKEIKGLCPTYKVGDSFTLKAGYQLVSDTPVCMHGLASLEQFKFSCTVFRYGMHEYISYRIKTAGCRRS